MKGDRGCPVIRTASVSLCKVTIKLFNFKIQTGITIGAALLEPNFTGLLAAGKSADFIDSRVYR